MLDLIDKIWAEFIPDTTVDFYVEKEPVAASRPRVGKWGAYYSGPYQKYRQTMPDMVDEIVKQLPATFDGLCLCVHMLMVVEQPKSTSLEYPDPDLDNYCKAVWDQMNAKVWDDDSRIVQTRLLKRWSRPDLEPGVYVVVESNGQEFKKAKRQSDRNRSVSSMPVKRQRRKRR
jgi:Holliday junction resolvase RusA-like endonuclease